MDPLVKEISRVSHDALRAEWKKIKRGETIYRLTKYTSITVMVLAVTSGIAYTVIKALP